MKRLFHILTLCAAAWLAAASPSLAARLEKPPLSERWFGIHVDGERVGFYRQKISPSPEGYLIEGDGSVRIKIMGFSREASFRESYAIHKNLTLSSFSFEQTLNNVRSLCAGKATDSLIRMKCDNNGSITEKQLKFRGEVYPGQALNIVPLMRDASAGKVYKLMTFDPEEAKVKEVKVTVLGREKAPEGQAAIRLRNNLYPFVNNDIWVDEQGNTLHESVREGLVITRAEEPKQIGPFVSGVALSKKDLIYDFSLVRVEPPLKDVKKLGGLDLEIRGWNDALPLMQGGGQTMEKGEGGIVRVRTGSRGNAAPLPAAGAAPLDERYLKPAEKIESDNAEIVEQSRKLTAGITSPIEKARALASWTAEWLGDTVEDGGGAAESYKKRSGNCQTHARLYTALARAAGIPTRFVSGLVYLEGKGFLYHSWAESQLEGRWQAVDPTYSQLPADPTHIKFFEGHLPEDLAPIIAIIGRIGIKVTESVYEKSQQ